MSSLYEEYPEILFCYAAYKTNENHMVLIVLMNIDENTESGFVGFYSMKSESCTLLGIRLNKPQVQMNSSRLLYRTLAQPVQMGFTHQVN